MLYLFLLVLVVIIPALVVSSVLLSRNNQAQQEIVRSLTNATVQSIGQSVERELAGMITTLRVLSTSESLIAEDYAQFYQRSAIALAGTGAYLLALDADFDMIFNTRRPFGDPLGHTSNPASARLALERGAATISQLFFGQTAQDWVFTVLLPVPDDHEAVLLILTQNATNLDNALQSRQLPTGWHAALVDMDNRIIASTSQAALTTGNVLPMRQTLVDNMDEWRRERFNGEAVVTSEWRSSLSGWRVIAWADADLVDRPLGDTLLWLAAWGAVLVCSAGVLVLLIARQVGASVRGLQRDAQRMGRGEMVAAHAYPVTEIAEVSHALSDASQRRRAAEQEVNFLMREVAHRSKNQMTVIAAMAKQTARGADDVASYVAAFENRILGLSSSTDLLLAHGSAGVSLKELIERQIGAFRPSEISRTYLNGPLVRLNMQAAQILGMAAHELATNAVKYGAFAGETGLLKVDWHIHGDRLALSWRETVEHMPPASERVGFGTTVLQSMVGRTLGATVERVLHADGIEWRFDIDRASIDPDRVDDSEKSDRLE